MTNLDQMRDSLDLPDGVTLDEAAGGLPAVTVQNATTSGAVFLHGGHVTAWRPAGHEPVLWMSAKSNFNPDNPIRGGVPICFPWFGPRASDASQPSHGWARLSTWHLVSVSEEKGKVVVALLCERDGWGLQMTVGFGSTLDLALTITNQTDRPQQCEAALHTYFDVGNINNVELHGLEKSAYRDSLANRRQVDATGQPIRFTGETDRIYHHAGSAVIHDAVLGREITIEKAGSESTVVWNPWIDKSARMADFGDDEWPGMLCVETAAVAPEDIELASGESHTIQATISVQSTPK